MAARLNPTRMNLIVLKGRIGKARKGYDILKRKREVLVLEFLKLLQQSKNDRGFLYSLLKDAYKTVTMASAYVGNFELEGVALHVDEATPIRINVKNIMGVRIPEIHKTGEAERNRYSFLSTNVAVDDIDDAFSKVSDTIVDIAQREQGLRRLVLEIDKTKRRVNALDYVVIPGMRSQAKYISMRLEEMDRDMFSALKHVKKKIAAAHEAESAQIN